MKMISLCYVRLLKVIDCQKTTITQRLFQESDQKVSWKKKTKSTMKLTKYPFSFKFVVDGDVLSEKGL